MPLGALVKFKHLCKFNVKVILQKKVIELALCFHSILFSFNCGKIVKILVINWEKRYYFVLGTGRILTPNQADEEP